MSTAVNTTMIKDFFIWHQGFHEAIAEAVNDPAIDKITLYAGEEWEISPNWHTAKYYRKLQDFAANKELHVVVGCHDTKLHKQNFVAPAGTWVHYWPTCWIHYTAEKLRPIVFPKHEPIKKVFMSLNNKAHWHRCMMMDMIAKNELFEHGDVSWHESKAQYNFRHWKIKRMTLDEDYPHMLNSYNTLPQSFSHTFISLVAEANMKAHFITEKTWMPVFFKRPFIIWGPKGIHSEMNYLGFDMFDEIIDYNFDTIEDDEQRCQAIMNILKSFVGKDLNALRQQIKPKLEKNYKLAREIAFDKSFYPPAVRDLCQRYENDKSIPATYHWAKYMQKYTPLK